MEKPHQIEVTHESHYAAIRNPHQSQAIALGGHVVGSISTVSLTVRAHLQGSLRVLALMEKQRWDKAGDLPTVAEAGFPLAAGSARGFALPAATPEPILARWEEAVRRTAEDPDFRAIAERDFLIVRHMNRATMRGFVDEQYATYGEMWRRTPWKK